MDTPYTRFIILSDARTGSTVLQQALNLHPNVVCFRELFNLAPSIDYDVDGWDPNSAADIELRGSDPGAFLRQRIFGQHDKRVRAVGFKFHYNHFWFHETLLSSLVTDVGLRVVHLQRRNALRTLVSLKLAEQTGVWLQHDEAKLRRQRLAAKLNWSGVVDAAAHPARTATRIRRFLAPINPAPVTEREPIALSHDECVRFFYTANHNSVYFEDQFKAHPLTRVWFEDFTADRDRVLGDVLRFLDAPPDTSMQPTLRRQNPEPLRELIANFEDLRASFAGSEYEPWFDD